MNDVRTKATELAVELLRPSMTNFNLAALVSVDTDDEFEEQTRIIAKRVGRVVQAVSLEIEPHIR